MTRAGIYELLRWLSASVIAVALVAGCVTASVSLVLKDEFAEARALKAHHEEVRLRESAAAKEAARQRIDAAKAADRARASQNARAAAARRAAARKAAEEAAAADSAAAARRAEKRAAEQEAAAEAAPTAATTPSPTAEVDPARQVIRGEITVPDINGALTVHAGGYPGQPLDTLGMRQLNKIEAMLRSLTKGKTYSCPLGAGGGYQDLAAGAQVTVEDGFGSMLATGSLTGGKVDTRGCTFTYAVEVPESEFYRVTVSHRGALTYSRAELVGLGWRVSGTL